MQTLCVFDNLNTVRHKRELSPVLALWQAFSMRAIHAQKSFCQNSVQLKSLTGKAWKTYTNNKTRNSQELQCQVSVSYRCIAKRVMWMYVALQYFGTGVPELQLIECVARYYDLSSKAF